MAAFAVNGAVIVPKIALMFFLKWSYLEILHDFSKTLIND